MLRDQSMNAVVFDAGPLIAMDRSDRRVIALLERVAERDLNVVVPAGALAQAVRDPARQARLSRFVRQPNVDVVALDRAAAVRVGRLLQARRMSDVVDAHVALCANDLGATVVTSDPDDIAALDPDLTVMVI